jgi:hypothetical protein
MSTPSQDFIHMTNRHVHVRIKVFTFNEGEMYYVYSPNLELVGYDNTLNGAFKSFNVVLDNYMDYTLSHNTINKDLSKLGWKKSPFINKFSQKIQGIKSSALEKVREFGQIIGEEEFEAELAY